MPQVTLADVWGKTASEEGDAAAEVGMTPPLDHL
jgi:hypothetical protein